MYFGLRVLKLRMHSSLLGRSSFATTHVELALQSVVEINTAADNAGWKTPGCMMWCDRTYVGVNRCVEGMVNILSVRGSGPWRLEMKDESQDCWRKIQPGNLELEGHHICGWIWQLWMRIDLVCKVEEGRCRNGMEEYEYESQGLLIDCTGWKDLWKEASPFWRLEENPEWMITGPCFYVLASLHQAGCRTGFLHLGYSSSYFEFSWLSHRNVMLFVDFAFHFFYVLAKVLVSFPFRFKEHELKPQKSSLFAAGLLLDK